jgi:hypothetical protein
LEGKKGKMWHLFTFLNVPTKCATWTKTDFFIWPRPLILIGCFTTLKVV